MKLSDIFLEVVKKQVRKPKIGITILRPIPETIASLKRAAEYADLTVIGAKVEGFKNIMEEDQDKASALLINLLKTGQVDGIVRGQVKDSFTLDEFHRQFGKEPLPSNRKIGPGILEKGDHSFVVSTCSIYQGMTLADKKNEVERIIKYMKEDLQVEPDIAIMSSLRPTSHVSQYPILDDLAAINQALAAYLKEKGYKVKEYYFEYESAVWQNANLVIPAMGLVGNAWLRALVYLGDWQMIACPYLDLDVAYEDGSRNEKDFFWHIVHCAAMINGRK